MLNPSDFAAHVLYEDNHLLVVNKPAELATMGVTEGSPSVITAAKAYLKRKYDKPGNVYLGVVSRLDALVSGVLVLARTSKAAARLTEQFRERETKKVYWAVVEEPPSPAAGSLVHWMRKEEQLQRMVITSANAPGSQEARLSYGTLRRLPRGILMEVRLETGRKHQIRLQLSQSGWPILGDQKYGSRRSFPAGIALHAKTLTITHPTLQTVLTFAAPLPEAWKSVGISNQEPD